MSFRDGQPGRKVRIVKRRMPSRAAGLSMAAVAATSVFAFSAWRWWHADEVPIVTPTLFEDTELVWKCEQGHVFEAQGQVGGRPCTVCGGMAYPFTTYHCSVHGSHEVKVQFDRDEQGHAHPSLYRVGNGQWTVAGEGPKCPRCEQIMTQKEVDPLEGRVKPKRKTSGS